ncbi:MAG: ShlB/FhaC/HecB family hemolysin secretion/activation protein [Vampirovibrionales bacterium]|nr:ShlB/FhaC/HecB family hemolysin secretion/activation protein [Vampirovibrionales bacterium]
MFHPRRAVYAASCLLAFSFVMAPMAIAGNRNASQLNAQNNPLLMSPIPPAIELGVKPAKPFEGRVLEVVDLDRTSESQKPATVSVDNVTLSGNGWNRQWAIKRAIHPLLKKLDRDNGAIAPAELETRLKDATQFTPFKLQGRVVKEEATGESTLHLDVYERQPWQLTLFSDNAGRPGTDLYRAGAQITNNNLLGLGDQLSITYSGVTRSQYATAEYALPPLNRRGGELRFRYLYHNSDIDTDYLALRQDPNTNGTSHIVKAIFTQPLDKQRHFSLYTHLTYAHLNFERNGYLTYGEDFGHLITGFKASVPDRLGKTDMDVFYLRGIASDVHLRNYWLINGSLSRMTQLPFQHKLFLKSRFQYANHYQATGLELPLGGFTYGRGYTEGLVNSDRGYAITIEDQFPIPLLNKVCPWVDKRLRAVAFVDAGQGWLDKTNKRFVAGQSNDSNRTLVLSSGLGLRARLTRFMQAYMDFGFVLGSKPDHLEFGSAPRVRIHFGVRSDLLASHWDKRENRPFTAYHRHKPHHASSSITR